MPGGAPCLTFALPVPPVRSPEDPSKEPASHIGPDKRDKDWTEMGITYSRCGGKSYFIQIQKPGTYCSM